jgi:hypothetical protein
VTPEQVVLAKKARLDFDNRLEEYNNYGPNDELVGEILDIACNLKDWLCHALDAIETHQSEIALARQDALLEVTKLACIYCKAGQLPLNWDEMNGYTHKLIDGGIVLCNADPVQQLLAAVDHTQRQVNQDGGEKKAEGTPNTP